MSTITEHKKLILSDYIKKLEAQISELYHALEEDQSISNDQFKVYEKMLDELFHINNQLNEEIIFS